jgi:hypothetical protein
MENKVVAHFRDGHLMKGTTNTFAPTKDKFHLIGANGKTIEIALAQLKALFFVKQIEGSRAYHEKKEFDTGRNLGRKIRCEFFDGEVLLGYCQGYDTKRLGFFIVPSDSRSNNERIFVINAAALKVSFI